MGENPLKEMFGKTPIRFVMAIKKVLDRPSAQTTIADVACGKKIKQRPLKQEENNSHRDG